MPYIEKQDFIDELGEDKLIELTDNDDAGTINDNRLNKAIGHAQGVVESYLRTRYSLPVAATEMVKTLNLDIAILHLYKGRSTVVKDSVYEVRKIANDDALKLLTAISQGKAALDIPAAEETAAAPANNDRILTNKSRAKFTDSQLGGF